ncbi:hypothetical protein [Polycladomyces subterraneus]|uniref:Uncharacterized protein n=1 Tax=Polycladomyces subterraneus TaxID=1016997 RepID=A0ABT8IPE4_9BACL|nr:hypothetical protein [Polycladomyces subterraneus]MDN4594634.1 hypothetical protein [Polycladomyces subterraneus]
MKREAHGFSRVEQVTEPLQPRPEYASSISEAAQAISRPKLTVTERN